VVVAVDEEEQGATGKGGVVMQNKYKGVVLMRWRHEGDFRAPLLHTQRRGGHVRAV